MAYNNYFPAGYQPYQYQQVQTQQRPGIIWVSGEAGAKAYLVAPNTSVVLFDSEAQTIYIKSADASGMPSIRTLDYTMRDNVPQNTNISPQTDYASKEDVDYLRKEIESLKAKFDESKGKEKKNG